MLTKPNFPHFKREPEPTAPQDSGSGELTCYGGHQSLNAGQPIPAYPLAQNWLERARNGLKREMLNVGGRELTRKTQIGQFMTGKICPHRLFDADSEEGNCQIDDSFKKSRVFGGKMLGETEVRLWQRNFEWLVAQNRDTRPSDFVDGFLAALNWVLQDDKRTPIDLVRWWIDE